MHGVPGREVILDALDDEANEVGVGVDKHRDEEVSDLLLRVLVTGEEVHGFHVSKVDVMTQEEDEKKLADILFLLVPIKRLVSLEL